MKIILTGAQGTGKSTILKEFQLEGYNVITEVVRNFANKGIKINEDGNSHGQKLIFDEYVNLFNSNPSFVSDRGLTDVLAYTKYLYYEDKVSSIEYMREMDKLKKFHDNNKDIVYIYFPIEFPLKDDGVRSMSETFREEIDKNIVNILRSFHIPYITVTGSIQKRMQTIKYCLEL